MKQKQIPTWPWKTVSIDNTESTFIIDKVGCRIASMNPVYGHEIAKRDASIMAAAPELLDNLQRIIETWNLARMKGVLGCVNTIDNVISDAAHTLDRLYYLAEK